MNLCQPPLNQNSPLNIRETKIYTCSFSLKSLILYRPLYYRYTKRYTAYNWYGCVQYPCLFRMYRSILKSYPGPTSGFLASTYTLSQTSPTQTSECSTGSNPLGQSLECVAEEVGHDISATKNY